MKRTRTSGNARAWYAGGVAAHYQQVAATYRNPHAATVVASIAKAHSAWSLDLTRVLDLAAGAGEVTLAVRSVAPVAEVAAMDPFTAEAYRAATGDVCEAISFEDIVQGALRDRRFTTIICSFAMHLAPLSLLPALGISLAQAAPRLVILTPHQRPALTAAMGWRLEREFRIERVRTRSYESMLG